MAMTQFQRSLERSRSPGPAINGGFINGSGAAVSRNSREDFLVQARADLTWGKTREQIMESLTSRGLPQIEAKRLLDELWRERQAAARKKGVLKMITGGSVALVSLLALWVQWEDGWIWFLPIIGVLWGGFEGVMGLLRFLDGAPEGEAVSDVEGF